MVVWDRHPLRLGATPRLVLIEGLTVVNITAQSPRRPSSNYLKNHAPLLRNNAAVIGSTLWEQPQQSVGIRGVIVHTMTGGDSGSSVSQSSILIENGIVTCVGAECAPGRDVNYNLEGGKFYAQHIHVNIHTMHVCFNYTSVCTQT